MNNQLHIFEDETFNFTEDERMAFAQMTDEQISDYWQAQQSYEEMKAYLEHPDTPEIVKNILTLSGWQEHNNQ
ncbi:hypothetical protein [Neisseria sp. Ec49-e6-T10]|uniref:hypothetical protein n=1 Tax=Neisseria sp. Ec49-e6-T10 TaxID=3140744 RepID=UPI003EBC4BB3